MKHQQLKFSHKLLQSTIIHALHLLCYIDNKEQNISYPVKILVGFYSIIYHSILGVEPDEQSMMIKENIDILNNNVIKGLPLTQKKIMNKG